MRIGIGTGIEYQATAGLPGPAVVFPPVNPNLLLWSEEFQQAEWTKSGVTVTADQENDPNGALTADLLDSAQTASRVFQDVADLPAGGTLTGSIYVLRSPGSAEFAAPTIQLVGADGTPGETGDTQATEMWTRITSIVTLGPAETGVSFRFFPDGAEDTECYAWGAKLEVGSVATAYVKREGV